MAKELPCAKLSRMDKHPQTKRTILTLKNRNTSKDTDVAQPLPSPPVPLAVSESSKTAAIALSDWLCQYSNSWKNFQPLSIGVINEVYLLLETHGMRGVWSKRAIHKTLFWHTTRPQYINRLQQEKRRYRLDGQVSGEISAAQQAYAAKQLENKRNKKGKKSR